jgi:Transposase IS116/IS110/IS902 family/Type III restriction enzyme, res subunit/Type I restriction enzyme R protein N terminus (HSDR_N)
MPSESQTRKEVIDVRLKDAGWDVSDRTQVIEEFVSQTSGFVLREDPPSYGSREFSDYVLLGKNGKPVAVVEAKKSTKDAEFGREQAKQYCVNIQIEQGGELPFCFYTNGHEIFFWNLGEAPPQRVHGFPSRQDLERLLYIRKHKKPLTGELINTTIAGRDYQLQAIRSVMEGIGQNRREFLLVMATGTGKTRTCIALEIFGWRRIRNGRELGALVGLVPAPYQSGETDYDQGITRAGNAHVRRVIVQLAWGWIRHQPDSALTRWYQQRFGAGGKRVRKIGIVALARKLLIALWRYLETGVVPDGAQLKPMEV